VKPAVPATAAEKKRTAEKAADEDEDEDPYEYEDEDGDDEREQRVRGAFAELSDEDPEALGSEYESDGPPDRHPSAARSAARKANTAKMQAKQTLSQM
jgi:hypothetical protein